MFLLTNQRGLSKKQAALLVKAYLKRWGNEEITRCLKQGTQVEDVRVRRDQSIQRIVSMAIDRPRIASDVVVHPPHIDGATDSTRQTVY